MLVLLTILFLAALLYFLGPKPNFASANSEMKALNIPLEELDDYIVKQEAKVTDLRNNNEARMFWADDIIQKTEYSIVYLHGFSAGPWESDPVAFNIAAKYKMNMYVARLADHGRSSIESFESLTPQKMIDSAKEAIAIGKLIGDKVIVMSCSTGSTLSVYLSAEQPGWIDAMVMYAPNMKIENDQIQIVLKPWGLQLARMMFNGKYRSIEMEEGAKPFWTTKYRLEGLQALTALVNETMTEDIWKKVDIPFMSAYYYEDEENRDMIISVPKIKRFHEIAATPENQKRLYPLPTVKSHCISNIHQSKDWKAVQTATEEFLEEVVF